MTTPGNFENAPGSLNGSRPLDGPGNGNGPAPRMSATRKSDLIFKTLCQISAASVILLLLGLIYVIFIMSKLSMEHSGTSFFTSTRWDPVLDEGHNKYGALAFIWGTLTTSAIAMAIAIPLGVGTALYLSEIASPLVRKLASFFIELLAAIPSVVYGFWGLLVLAPWLQRVIINPLDGPNIGGKGILSCGILIAIMILPYICAISFDVIRAVPVSQRQGAYALGASRWQVIWTAVIPFARPGIIGGAFIALGRALGETMAATMIIGNQATLSLYPFAKGDTIASVIANQFNGADFDLYRSSLAELALVLLAVNLVINAIARVLIVKLTTTKKTRAASVNPTIATLRQVGSVVGSVVSTAGLLLLPALIIHAFLQVQQKNDFYLFGPTTTVPSEAGAHLSLFGGLVYYAGHVLVWEAILYAVMLAVRFGVPLLFRNATRFAHVTNIVMTNVLRLLTLASVGPLFFILGYLIQKGFGSLSWAFFTELPVNGEAEGGMVNAIYGSLVMVGLATVMAVPIGLLSAIYMVEYSRTRLARYCRLAAELFGGVPSIVVGLFIAAVIVLPVFKQANGWAGAIALATMMLPIVIRASEEAMKLVPPGLRQASYALGATQFQTVSKVLVPAALPAIITAIFLSIARIAGETAPLLLTAGGNNFMAYNPSDQMAALPMSIYFAAIDPSEVEHAKAWSGALVLMIVVMLLNFGVRFAAGNRAIAAARSE